jgi:hypothetical protein
MIVYVFVLDKESNMLRHVIYHATSISDANMFSRVEQSERRATLQAPVAIATN